LEELIKDEGTVRPLPSRPAISSQHIFRWLIFLILVLGIGWKVFTGSQDVPMPEISAEALDLSSAINALPAVRLSCGDRFWRTVCRDGCRGCGCRRPFDDQGLPCHRFYHTDRACGPNASGS
jgi:hypothetical protein